MRTINSYVSMLKNGFVSAMALVGLLGLAACGGEGGEAPEVVEEQAPPVTTETEQVAPEAIRGTVVMDTTGAGTVIDTTSVPADTGGQR